MESMTQYTFLKTFLIENLFIVDCYILFQKQKYSLFEYI